MVKQLSVIGAGTMGAGIAQSGAVAGYAVTLYDIAEPMLEAASERIAASLAKGVTRGKIEAAAAAAATKAIQTTTSLAEAALGDLVIEAVPERIDLKRELLATLASSAAPHTILASNTSSLSINVLAAATDRQDRFLGLHFFNPAHIMKLVEIIRGDYTSEATLATAHAFVASLGKTAVLCRDTPAFIVNRVARPFYGEAFRLLGEGAADHAAIDECMKSIGFRMGPFELIDLIGSDINYDVTQAVYDAYFQEPKYRPHPLQRQMVASGRLGRKTGLGFYNYSE